MKGINCNGAARRMLHGKRSLRTALVVITLILCTGTYAQVDIHKKWVIGTEQDGLTLIDLSRSDILVKARTASAEDVKESHGANQPGIFFLDDKSVYRVVPSSPTSGDIEIQLKDGSWITDLMYMNLTKNKVTFLFEGEYEWEGHVVNNVEVVNPNTLELNIDDISHVFNFRQEDDTAIKDLCQGKNMTCLVLQEDDENGLIELWGRGLRLEGTKVVRNGNEEAMGIIFKQKVGEYIETAIMFSDKKLLKEYETQLARRWCFPRRTRNIDGAKEVTYADRYWEEESDEPAYILSEDSDGLYTISYFVMD